MATCSIWKIESNLAFTIKYVKNPDKTVAIWVEMSDGEEVHTIKDVLNYATRNDKTNDMGHTGYTIKEYVTGINCNKDTAYEEMLLVKKRYNKTDKILAWHGYQSFKPGEVTPEEAHQIGIELAEALWGDRFQVVVTTHLDQKHIHNHFVVNSVSMIDGKKFYANRASYFKMREESDRICMEHGLSVIENPKYNGVTRGAYRAKEGGRYTIEKIVREDIDRIIKQSISLDDFLSRMKKEGYLINAEGKYVTVFPYGHSRGIRIDRRWGEYYSLSGIERQIEANLIRGRIRSSVGYKAGRVNRPLHRYNGFRATYSRFLYKTGRYPHQRKGYTNKQMHFVMREELLKLDTIKAEMDFLRINKISSTAGLDIERSKLELVYSELKDKREKVRNKLRRAPEDKREAFKKEIDSYNEKIRDVRRKLYYCNDIEERSEKLQNKMQLAEDLQQGKEIKGGKDYGRSERSRDDD